MMQTIAGRLVGTWRLVCCETGDGAGRDGPPYGDAIAPSPLIPPLLPGLAIGGLLALAACAGVETRTGVYATLAEARAAGAIERGWIPEGLPASATDLREAHRGTDQRWGVFSFPSSDGPSVRALIDAEITGPPPDCSPPGRLEWWPKVLRSPVDPAQVRATGLRVYRGRDGRLTYAVNWSQGRGFYWSS